MKKYSLYLAGSIAVWKRDFQQYAPHFNKDITLFEPGVLDVPEDHTLIGPAITARCAEEIRGADAVLAYMKHYAPADSAGAPGVDSSWECGYAYGLGKPVLALIDSLEHFLYYEDQWMLSHHVAAFVTLDEEVVRYAAESTHYDNPHVILVDHIENIETAIAEFISSQTVTA